MNNTTENKSHNFVPVAVNSILFILGLLCLILHLHFLCAICLLIMSLLFLWNSGFLFHYELDTIEYTNEQNHTADDTSQRLELYLRIQELTEANELLLSDNQRLLAELENKKSTPLPPAHPLYDCPLTSSLPIALHDFFIGYIHERTSQLETRGIQTEYFCAAPEAQTQLSMSALQIICNNVFDNMIKFSQQKIYIHIANINEDTLIIFKNSGEGIPESELTQIFLLNYQGANHSSGTGLGLAQVKAIVDDFGGRVWAKSTPESGFTLYLQLPFRRRTPDLHE